MERKGQTRYATSLGDLLRLVRHCGIAWFVFVGCSAARSQTASFLFDRSGNLEAQSSSTDLPPRILGRIQDQIVAPNATANFSVVAANPGSLRYQWLFNGVPIGGQTGRSLLLQDVTRSDEGSYQVVLTNPSGTVTSAPAMLWMDKDGDGLGDSWELAQFGNLSQSASSDFDGDGLSNLREFVDQSDPTDPGSARYRLLVIREGGSIAKTPDQSLYDKGTIVTLSITSGPNELFHAWLGDVVTRDNPITLVMTNDKVVTARFTPIDFVWTNSVSGAWESAGNWSPNLVPGMNDKVWVTNAVAVTLNTEADCADVTLADPRTELTVNAALRVRDNFSWAGGKLSGNGRVLLESNALMDIGENASMGNCTLENRGTIVWRGSLFVAFGGAVVTNAPGALFKVERTAASVFGGGIANARFDNAGTFRKGNGSGPLTFSSGLNFNNSGTLAIETNLLICAGGFTNDGVVVLSPGTTNQIGAGGLGSGTFVVPPTAVVEWIGGSFVLNDGAQLNGGGLFRVDGRAVLLADANFTVSNLQLLAGTFGGSGTVIVANEMNWNGGTMSGAGRTVIAAVATLNIANPFGVGLNSRTLENAGFVQWTGDGFIGMNFDAVITNRAGATFHARNAARVASGAGGNRFDNVGTFRKSNDPGTTMLEAILNNHGTVEVESGTLQCNGRLNNLGAIHIFPGTTNRMAGGGSADGMFNAPADSLVEWIGGTFTVNPGAQLDGPGLYRVDGIGTRVVGNGDVIVKNLDLVNGSSTWDGAGKLTVANSMNWSAGTMEGSGRTIIAASAILNVGGPRGVSLHRTLENGGDANWTGSGIWILLNGVITNRVGALFHAQNDSRFHFGGGTCRFDNAGTFRKSIGTGVTEIGVGFANLGTVDLRAGILKISGGFTSSSDALLICALGGTTPGASHGQLQVNGSVALNGALRVDLVNGFVPAVDDSFTVLTAGSRNGTFSPFIHPSDLILMQLINTPNTVSIRATGFPVFEVVLFPPVLTPSNVVLSWAGVPAKSYQVEFNPGFGSTDWFRIPGEVINSGNQVSFVDPLPATNRFYRVRLLP